MEELKNKFVTLNAYIDGFPTESHFEVKTQPISMADLRTGQVLVKTIYVSVDPYQLNLMKSPSASRLLAGSFFATFTPGQPIFAFGIGRVVASARPDFRKGELVTGFLTWGEYAVVEEGVMLNKLDPVGLPLSYYMGPLGSSGLTAYGGFFELCKPKKGESVFVSAAAGSVGNLVGQYAKIVGCHVVGCAGTQQKVDLLKREFGFDDAFNYKDETDLKFTLKRYFPNGIDIYFDNVGGEMLEAVVANMNELGRVAVCGAISEYTGSGRKSSLQMWEVVYKRIIIQGFTASQFLKSFEDFISTTAEYIRAGKMKVRLEVMQGIESVPSAFVRLFRGDNVGKVVVQVADEE